MGKRKNDSLTRRTGTRRYRPICWISSEGYTEIDYFTMDAFRGINTTVKFPKNIHPDRRNPAAVLKRLQKTLQVEDFRADDEAWVVVDVDTWDQGELESLFAWAAEDSRYHVAISNPKFELYLVMHYENGNGCTTAARVDAALKQHLPGYSKRLKRGQFSLEQIRSATEVARKKRTGCGNAIPNPGMTDAHLIVERLIGCTT